MKPDVFLLGEIWHDSVQWLQGDEYDSVMNFPFLETLNNFWLDNQDARHLMYGLNRCQMMYPEQVNRAIFNFLDNHDTMRSVTRCGNKDIFFQQLVLLMEMKKVSNCLRKSHQNKLQSSQSSLRMEERK